MNRRIAVATLATGVAGGAIIALVAAATSPPDPFDGARCPSKRYELGIEEPSVDRQGAAATPELAASDEEASVLRTSARSAGKPRRHRVDTQKGGVEFRYTDDAGLTVAAIYVTGSGTEEWRVARSVACA